MKPHGPRDIKPFEIQKFIPKNISITKVNYGIIILKICKYFILYVEYNI